MAQIVNEVFRCVAGEVNLACEVRCVISGEYIANKKNVPAGHYILHKMNVGLLHKMKIERL